MHLGELLLKLAGLRRSFFKEPLEGRHSEILTEKANRGKNEWLLMQLVTPHLFGSISAVFYRPSEESVNRAVEPLFGVTSSLEGPCASLGKTVSIEFQWFDIPLGVSVKGYQRFPQES